MNRGSNHSDPIFQNPKIKSYAQSNPMNVSPIRVVNDNSPSRPVNVYQGSMYFYSSADSLKTNKRKRAQSTQKVSPHKQNIISQFGHAQFHYTEAERKSARSQLERQQDDDPLVFKEKTIPKWGLAPPSENDNLQVSKQLNFELGHDTEPKTKPQILFGEGLPCQVENID